MVWAAFVQLLSCLDSAEPKLNTPWLGELTPLLDTVPPHRAALPTFSPPHSTFVPLPMRLPGVLTLLWKLIHLSIPHLTPSKGHICSDLSGSETRARLHHQWCLSISLSLFFSF